MGLELTYRVYFPGAVCVAKVRSNWVLPEPATGVMLVMGITLVALSKVRLAGVKLDGRTAWLNVRRIVPSVFAVELFVALTTTSPTVVGGGDGGGVGEAAMMNWVW